MKTLKILSLMMAVAMVAAAKIFAGDTSTANPFFGALSTVSPAELPAKSAELIAQADSKAISTTTVDVVKAAVGLNPAAAAAIVGTIAESTPKMASVAAATAVSLVPNQAIGIAHAAAAAAPSEAGKIVEAVCRVVPNAFKEVAETVSEVAPGAGKAILAGISAAIPSLQDPIVKVLAGSNGASPSVSDVLDQISPSTIAMNGNGMPIAAPQFQPPFAAIPPSPVNIDPGNGGSVPPGGRKYDLPSP